jgi:hypothetical protein
MLHRSLSEHAAGCFYGSEPLAARLWAFLLAPRDGDETRKWVQINHDCYQLLVESVDTRHPRRYRLNDIRQLINALCDGSLFTGGDLPELEPLFDRLMMRHGDLICYRETEVQTYVRLAAELDPTLMVAWHISGWLAGGTHPTEGDIRRIVAAQRPFFAAPGNPVLPFAEGHVHFGGITVADAVFGEYLLAETASELKISKKDSDWHQLEKSQLNLSLKRLRQLLWLLLDDNRFPQAKDPADRAKKRKAAWQRRTEMLNNSLENTALPDWSLLATTYSTEEVGSPGWLLGEFASAMQRQSHDRWLWLHLYLCCCYRRADTLPQQRVAILCWLQTLNDARRRLIMDGQGLTRFSQRAYSSPLERPIEAQWDNIRRLLPDGGDVAEIKAMPGAFNAKAIASLATQIAEQSGHPCPPPPYIFGEHETAADARAMKYMQALERWQFCGHFSRSNAAAKPGETARADMGKQWKQALNIMKTIDDTSAWNRPEFMNGHLNSHFHFQPGRWFRGLDVAGDENDLRIEWFAPLLRWLRRGFISRPDGERPSSGFHFSIHAGEDYAHPASGMRHIDETVQFCEMRDGDRLGHALALGIEPQVWLEQQGEMILRVDEHLDNLVWLRHYAVMLSGMLPLAQQVLPLLDMRIKYFYPLTGWQAGPLLGQETITPDAHSQGQPQPECDAQTLYNAWHLRRNCYYQLSQLQGIDLLSPLEAEALPDISTLKQDGAATRNYLHRHQHIAAETTIPLVIVRAGDEWQARQCHQNKQDESRYLQDVETPAELEFMHALQDYLLDRYDRMGLIIETNPTSNVYIARLDKHSQHPIFRWNPPDESVLMPGQKYNRFGLRRGPVRVLVNTDDPGIMPTTLRTEFLLLREAAIDSGISRTVAECWLEKLRQYGMEQFHRHHQPVFELN